MSVITPEIKDDAIKTKGYFIYPSQLFANIAKGANTNESLNTDLAAIFAAIESSANGYPSEGRHQRPVCRFRHHQQPPRQYR